MSLQNKLMMVVRIDEDRVGAVIGPKGSILKRIEEALNVIIKVRKDKAEVIIVSERQNIENALRAKMIIEAIANGISSSNAFVIVDNPDYVLEIVNIDEYARNRRDLRRIKSRIIGKEGKIKRLIEDELDVKISIRQKKVAILGKYMDVQIAKEAIISICKGSKYGRILRKIEEFKMQQQFREITEF